jgi:hypothetical protein
VCQTPKHPCLDHLASGVFHLPLCSSCGDAVPFIDFLINRISNGQPLTLQTPNPHPQLLSSGRSLRPHRRKRGQAEAQRLRQKRSKIFFIQPTANHRRADGMARSAL